MNLLSELVMLVTHIIALTEVAAFCIIHRLCFSARKVVFEEFAHTPRTLSGLTFPLLNISPEDATKLFVSGGSTDLSTRGITIKKNPNSASSPQHWAPILYISLHRSLWLALTSCRTQGQRGPFNEGFPPLERGTKK